MTAFDGFSMQPVFLRFILKDLAKEKRPHTNKWRHQKVRSTSVTTAKLPPNRHQCRTHPKLAAVCQFTLTIRIWGWYQSFHQRTFFTKLFTKHIVWGKRTFTKFNLSHDPWSCSIKYESTVYVHVSYLKLRYIKLTRCHNCGICDFLSEPLCL